MAKVDIPMVLITEILSRLPVKSLVRFRCVSKPWESLTRDPHFIKLHLKHSLQNHTNRALIMRESYMYSLDFPSLNEVTLINHPLKSDGCGTELFGSCNGLLCLSNGDEEGMYGTIFYNPATREQYEIPATPIKFPEDPAICDHMVYGFGYDHVNDDYKLMRIVQFFERDESDVKVYSLKSGCWECTCEFPREYHLTYRRAWGFHVNGCLHWVVNRKPKSDGTKSIIAFDLVSREYKILSQPEYSDDGEFHMNVGVLNGCLYVMCNYVGVKSDFWIMKEYGVHNSWTKLISIVQGGVLGLFEYVRPLACSKDGSRVLAEQEGKQLFWFDLEGQTVENVKVSGLPSLLDSEMMVESLVPLECHNKNRKQKLKIKKEQPKRKKNKSQRRRVRDSDMDAFLDKGFKLKL